MTNQMPSSNDQTRRRASYDIRVHVGRWARVHTCFGGYELPAGLPENAEVRLEAFDRGYWTVRFEGEVFEVAMACVGRAGILWVEPRLWSGH
jgi:hypothetical protein